ncbi:glutamate racemase [Silvanigrella aquatica]|uniref:Glutamate racemase n=1 Tax=Silvanigrella aquatica TaxID=1915309 RepID=A0A1L4D1Z7_9BACT|nr:glutamate racemase [Silvanigrella aquatica]APJ04214.1 glutamate racemase [Silvanigrella aquatica]
MKNKILPNIAFFDSSQGGLTVWENVLKRFPKLNTQYLGDNARCPYGNKSKETITRYASEAALFLANRNATLLVIACGTASSVAAKELQHLFKLPIIGIVDGFCKFVAQILTEKSRTVAVLGTRFTIRSNRFNEELTNHGIEKVWTRACPLLVPLVEEGISQGPIADAACDMYLWDIPEDTKIVMLACTHYPRLTKPIAESIERRLGKTVIYKTIDGDWILKIGTRDTSDPIYLVETSLPIVNYVNQYISENKLEDKLYHGEKRVLCTDSPEQFESIARFFTSIPLPKVEAVEIQT